MRIHLVLYLKILGKFCVQLGICVKPHPYFKFWDYGVKKGWYYTRVSTVIILTLQYIPSILHAISSTPSPQSTHPSHTSSALIQCLGQEVNKIPHWNSPGAHDGGASQGKIMERSLIKMLAVTVCNHIITHVHVRNEVCTWYKWTTSWILVLIRNRQYKCKQFLNQKSQTEDAFRVPAISSTDDDQC